MKNLKCRVFWNGKMLFSEKGDFVVYMGDPHLNEYGDMVGLDGCSELMYCSGSVDINNNDIYEGDNLKTWYPNEDSFYDDDNKEIVNDYLETTVTNFNIVEIRYEDFDTWTLEWAIEGEHSFEIMSNIHENKDQK